MGNHKTESPVTRRTAIKHGLLGAAGLALYDPRAALARTVDKQLRAKSVIQIWMWGGPSHLDTLRPQAPHAHSRSLSSAPPASRP